MDMASQQPQVRPDIVREMREMALQGATVPQLVRMIQLRAGYKDELPLPILWYFTKGFCLPLPTVLPLREWFLKQNDQEINAILLPEIEGKRAQWASSKE